MSYPVQRAALCEPCKGTGEVGIIHQGPALFEDIIGKPLPYTVEEAKRRLRGRKGSNMLATMTRSLAERVVPTKCPACDGTGNAYTLQQLDPIREPVE